MGLTELESVTSTVSRLYDRTKNQQRWPQLAYYVFDGTGQEWQIVVRRATEGQNSWCRPRNPVATWGMHSPGPLVPSMCRRSVGGGKPTAGGVPRRCRDRKGGGDHQVERDYLRSASSPRRDPLPKISR